MRILFLTHAFNSLAQRLHAELTDAGHEVSVEFDINDAVTIEAVAEWQPDLIVAPFLKRAIPEQIWRTRVCLIVHPGIPGDRGPSALDWAILNGETIWGVTVLQANAEMDAGPVWAWKTFPMRDATKSSLYRTEVTEAAVAAVFEAVERFESGTFKPLPSAACAVERNGTLRPLMRQADRRIDWQEDDTKTVLRKLRASDGSPGVETTLCGMRVRLFNAHREPELRGRPGEAIARSDEAVCIATRDGAIWIGYCREIIPERKTLKLPTAQVLARHMQDLPRARPRTDRWQVADALHDMRYEERGAIGYLYFDCHNGAMSTAQCERLREAFLRAKQRPTRVIVLMGGEDFWSNGLHLNIIEAAGSPADESWRNINAMDDLCREIINTSSHLTLAAVRGNAGAGGVFLALSADLIYARRGVIFNPHYKNMGNLYGSEYWTYLLPRRVGTDGVRKVMQHRLPLSADNAVKLGLIDACLPGDHAEFRSRLEAIAHELADEKTFLAMRRAKQQARASDEAQRPLDSYREDELRHMKLNFYGFDPSYHVARYKFVYRIPHAWTPLHLAHHRRLSAQPLQTGALPAAQSATA